MTTTSLHARLAEHAGDIEEVVASLRDASRQAAVTAQQHHALVGSRLRSNRRRAEAADWTVDNIDGRLAALHTRVAHGLKQVEAVRRDHGARHAEAAQLRSLACTAIANWQAVVADMDVQLAGWELRRPLLEQRARISAVQTSNRASTAATRRASNRNLPPNHVEALQRFDDEAGVVKLRRVAACEAVQLAEAAFERAESMVATLEAFDARVVAAGVHGRRVWSAIGAARVTLDELRERNQVAGRALSAARESFGDATDRLVHVVEQSHRLQVAAGAGIEHLSEHVDALRNGAADG